MATSVAKVVGANAREIRLEAGVTLDRLAVAMKFCGLRWSTGRISSFESGHVPAKIETLYAVALALGRAAARRVSLADLMAGEGAVVINDELSVDLSALRDAASRRPVTVGETEMTRKQREAKYDGATGQMTAASARAMAEAVVGAEFREADVRVCKKLGVAPEQGALAMGRLWGHTFSRERDLLAGPDAKPQHRGNISRQLQADLQAELEKARVDGDD